jgi:hypothetical protein
MSACPPLSHYAPEFVAKLSSEVEALPAGSTIVTVIADCAVLRAQIRACRKDENSVSGIP